MWWISPPPTWVHFPCLLRTVKTGLFTSGLVFSWHCPKPAFCVDHLTRSAFISRPFLCCLTPSSPHRRTQAILLIALGQSKPSGQSKPLGTWIIGLCVCAKSLQLCPTLCNPMDCSSPGSSVHGILQARVLEWVAMPSSRGYSRPRDQTQVSCISCIGRRVFYQ